MLFSLLCMVLRGVFRLASAGDHAEPVKTVPEIKRRDLLGGLICEYHAVAA